jgi:putative Mn2+ efflux pump MntP
MAYQIPDMLLMAVIVADDNQSLVLANGVSNKTVGLLNSLKIAKVAQFMGPGD